MFRKVISGSIKIFLSSAIIKVFSFIYVPLLARWLGPEKLGLYSLATLLVPWFSMFASFGAEATMTKLVAEHKAQNKPLKELVGSSFTLFFATASMASLIHFLIAPLIANYFFHSSALTFYIQLASLIIFVDVVYLNILAILRGEKQFGRFAFISSVQQGLLVAIGIVLVYCGLSITGAILAWIASIAIILVPVITKIRNYLSLSANKEYVKLILKTGLSITAVSVIIIIYSSLDKFFLGVFTSEKIVGLYIPALTIADAILMINVALRKSAFSFISASFKVKPEEAKNYIVKTTKYALLITGAICLATLIHAKEIIAVLAGPEYASSLNALKILLIMPLFFTTLMVSCASLMAMGKANKLIVPTFVGLAVSIAITALTTYKFGFLGAATSNVICSVILAIIFGVLTKKEIGTNVTSLGIIFTTLLTMGIIEGLRSLNWTSYATMYVIFVAYGLFLFYKFLSREERKTILLSLTSRIYPKNNTD